MNDQMVYEHPAGWTAFLRAVAGPVPSAVRFGNRSTLYQQLSASALEISRHQLVNLITGAAALPAFSRIARAETRRTRG